MTTITPVSFREQVYAPLQTQKSESSAPIFNFDDQNPVRQNNGGDEVRFDAQGYPIADGTTLMLREEERVLLGLIKKPAQYTYIANGRETIGEIKQKFHIKDGAIKKCNPCIRDDYWTPDKGREIYFYKEDIDTQK